MNESFLERWSRRKRDVAQDPAEPETAPGTPKVVEDLARDLSACEPAAAESQAAPAAEEPAFDLSQLPSIESITAETDIRAFLAPGVPATVRHAALRRAWSADPTIRDFVGLSENAWDFTAPDGVPGFGPIGSPEEVQRMLAQLTGGWPEAAEKSSSEGPGDVGQAPVPMEETAATEDDPVAEMNRALASPQQEQVAADPADEAANTELLQDNKDRVALQHEDGGDQYAPTSTRRPHGRALPE